MIFKGILLWFTAFFTIIVLSAVDSMTLGQLVVGLSLSIIFIFICTQVISKRELDILSGNKILQRLIEGKKD